VPWSLMASAVGVLLEAAGTRVPMHGRMRRSPSSSWSRRQQVADAKVVCEQLVSKRHAQVRVPVGEGEVARWLDKQRGSK
jgi:hypothetical protein